MRSRMDCRTSYVLVCRHQYSSLRLDDLIAHDKVANIRSVSAAYGVYQHTKQ